MSESGIWYIRIGGRGINFTCEVIASSIDEAIEITRKRLTEIARDKSKSIKTAEIIKVERIGRSYSSKIVRRKN